MNLEIGYTIDGTDISILLEMTLLQLLEIILFNISDITNTLLMI